MIRTARIAATDCGVEIPAKDAAAATLSFPVRATASPARDRRAEYQILMRKWWFAAAVGVLATILSYPWLFPGLRDLFMRGGAALWWLWGAMGIASLAALGYSGGQFFTDAWEALMPRPGPRGFSHPTLRRSSLPIHQRATLSQYTRRHHESSI